MRADHVQELADLVVCQPSFFVTAIFDKIRVDAALVAAHRLAMHRATPDLGAPMPKIYS